MLAKSFLSGTVEGFFGPAWSWEDREDHIGFLKDYGLNYYIYAPKSDPFLRKQWTSPFPKNHLVELRRISKTCKKNNVFFGIGFSPFEIFHNFSSDAKQRLKRKLDEICEFSPDVIGIFFDDMDGRINDLAILQSQIVNYIQKECNGITIQFCPTYYSYDPILDKVFGKRPKNYLESLGNCLNPDVSIMWTGENVVSSKITCDHLIEVSGRLGRKPFLWDNYPVNDGPKNWKYLFLDALRNRESDIKYHLSGYVANPMNQAHLSKIPLHTIAQFLKNPSYCPSKALDNAMSDLIDSKHRSFLKSLVIPLKNKGWDKLTGEEKAKIKIEASMLQAPWANELVKWVDGYYKVGQDCLTQ